MYGCVRLMSMTVGALVRVVVGAHKAAGCRPSPTTTGAGCGQSGGITGVLTWSGLAGLG